jgi:dGTP triphosphohydrolase
VVDVVQTSSGQIAGANPVDIDAVRELGAALVQMSEATRTEHLGLKGFLRDNVYRHYRVQRMTRKARAVVTDLFQAFMEDLLLLPDEHRDSAARLEAEQGATGRARAVADYVAGMTDRYFDTKEDHRQCQHHRGISHQFAVIKIDQATVPEGKGSEHKPGDDCPGDNAINQNLLSHLF